MASYGWDVVKNSWSGEKSYLHIQPGEPKLKAASWIQLEVARKALAAAGQDLDKLLAAARQRDFQPIALPLSLKAHIVSQIRPFTSNNVVAMLPGADAKLKDQAIFYTAHYDHFGVHAGEPGDNIYNGALDNATGCAMILELARAWSQAMPRPKRSIYFAAVTAEEQGLLGSEYLGKHPPLPAKNIQLDLNYDDVKPYGYPEQLELVGYDRTSFAPVVEQTAKAFGLKIMPDAAPEAGHYYRSDHFSMARVGVPAFSVGGGRKYRGKSEEWGNKMYDDYTAKDYHKPSDEFREEFDFTANAVLAKFGFALGWKAAQQPGEVEWKKGDEFERARQSASVRIPEIYRKWLAEDVVWLLKPGESESFLALESNAARDAFVNRFWDKRDPTPTDGVNEFKQEWYRRIAYSNEHFSGRGAGWRSDRGHAYIVMGPPDEVVKLRIDGHNAEVWRYAHLSCPSEGRITFIDRFDNGDYSGDLALLDEASGCKPLA
jgi:GWxTD domain-containing protein